MRLADLTRGQRGGALVVVAFAAIGAAALIVIAARAILAHSAPSDFVATYSGTYELPHDAPMGIPAWLGWQHWLNAFLIALIIQSGWRVRRQQRPTAHWTPRRGSQRKISLMLWLHQSLDVIWLVNGAVFIVLLFATGQWMRVVPTSVEVIPNAISAALQYASLDWPTENGWVNYNSLQQLAYFVTIFIAAPLAAVTGFRMSDFWPKKARWLNRWYPIEWARRLHFPVMLYFLAFIIVHVFLVLSTGALRNLNHMYTSRDVEDAIGFAVFAGSLLVTVAALVAMRPVVLAPIARLFGTVSR